MAARQLPDFSGAARRIPGPVAPPESSIPQHYLNPGLSLLQILSIVQSYWRQTVIIGMSITVITAVVVKLLPKTYEATATLIVDWENKDPLAGQEFPLNMLQNYVTTQTELMQSPVVLSTVVDRLQLTQNKDYAAGFGGGDANALREYVEKNLSATVDVNAGTGGQLLYVTAAAKNPVTAAQIANAVADVYLEEERRRANDPAGERAQRYSEQLAELRTKATAAQDAIAEFRQKTGITDLTAVNTSTEVEALDSLEQRLLEAQNVRRSLEARQAGQGSTSDEALASQLVGGLKTQLNTQEAQLAQLSAVYGPEHPKVVELQSQIVVTRRSLDAALHQLTENVSTELARAKELEAETAAAVAAQRAKVLQLRALQDQGAKLMLVLDSAQAVYKRALDGYDQVLFASVGHYTDVSFISRAIPAVKATKPNKVKLLLMGTFAGFFLGLAGTVAYELLFNRRLRCRDDIEREFGIPVLAELDPIPAGSAAA